MADSSNQHEELWREALTHGHKSRWSILPSNPRCSICGLPFGGFGGIATRAFGVKPSGMNPHICNSCEIAMPPGGAEIDVAILFADVRGSTALAEQLGASAFAKLLNRFYRTATDSILAYDGIVNKMIGDEVMALFLPLSSPDYRRAAILAAQHLIRSVRDEETREAWLPIGIGVHAGTAFVGKIGSEGVYDFTALGDTVNTASRLQSEAEAGKIILSEEIYQSASDVFPDLESRTVELRGKQESVSVRLLNTN